MANRKRASEPKKGVSLAAKAGAKRPSPPPAKKKKRRVPPGKLALIILLTAIIVALLVFLILGMVAVYKAAVAPDGIKDDVSLTSHATTPAALKDKVAYYLIGLMGEDETKATESLAVLCWDKKAQTVNLLQIPQAAYLDDTTRWASKTIGNVWANPRPLDWCSSCRCQLAPEEITDGKHNKPDCGAEVTQMPGSSSQDLLSAVNVQYGLPLDGYFLMPQEGLVKLVNLLGGIDVSLEEAMTVGEVVYPAGVQTLDGTAALQYALNRGSGIDGDIGRLVRQRKVFLALFQRLAREADNEKNDEAAQTRLLNDSIGPLMNGSTPLYSDHTRQEMADLVIAMRKIPPSSMTAYVMPGQSASSGSDTVFSVHRDALLALLNEAFTPYGDKLTEGDLKLTELANSGGANQYKQVLSEIEVPQSGAVATTTAAETTVAAA